MEGSTAINIGAFTEALTTAVAVSDVVTLLASIVGIGMGFVLMWFAVRKAYRMFISALTRGKASI